MRPFLLLLALAGVTEPAAQGRLLDPGRSALGVAAGYVLPDGLPGSSVGALAQVGRFGWAAGIAESPPGFGLTCFADGACPQAEGRPSLALAASWAFVEQREGRPVRAELVAEVGLERYGWVGFDDGFSHRRGALGLIVSSRADAHRPVLLAPFASVQAEVAETRWGTERRTWFGGGLGWGLELASRTLVWVEGRSEADPWRGRYRTIVHGGVTRAF